MDKLNQLLIDIHVNWMNNKAVDINNLVKLNGTIRELNRKEHKPLIIKITFTLLGRLKTIQGHCNYCSLHTDSLPQKNALWCEMTIWSKKKKISYGHAKTIKYRKTISIQIPIINLIKVEENTVPRVFAQRFLN